MSIYSKQFLHLCTFECLLKYANAFLNKITEGVG
jgi:hypothetical protein